MSTIETTNDNDEDKEQITNPTMNIIFIFDLQKSNNYNNT
jgi:hypothetical protein